MGLYLFSSASSKKSRGILHFSSDSLTAPSNTEPLLPNPRPDRYKILDYCQIGKYLIIQIKYLDCTNYEGKKTLVFKTTITKLKKQKLIDPHFMENKEYISPIARFEPTLTGWINARKFVDSIS